jgi:hypothetical protein
MNNKLRPCFCAPVPVSAPQGGGHRPQKMGRRKWVRVRNPESGPDPFSAPLLISPLILLISPQGILSTCWDRGLICL